MLYTKFIKEAFDIVLVEDEETGVLFLDPHYKVTLKDANLHPEQISDYDISWEDMVEVFMLEVERRNAVSDRSRAICNWLYGIIHETIDPALTQANNEQIKNVLEYMKFNMAKNDKEENPQGRTGHANPADAIMQIIPGMNFSKKTPK